MPKDHQFFIIKMLKINVSLQQEQQQKMWVGFSSPQKDV